MFHSAALPLAPSPDIDISALLETTPASESDQGVPLHKLFKGKDFYLLIVYKIAGILVEVSVSSFALELHYQLPSVDPREIEKDVTSLRNTDFIKRFIEQKQYAGYRTRYSLTLDTQVKTSSPPRKEGPLFIYYTIPFQNQR